MDKTNNTKSVSKSRRNLIKASAAAPVIASLHPGAAAASSAFQCAQGNNHYDKYTANSDDDRAVRQKVYRIERHSGNSKFPEALYYFNEHDTVFYDKDGNVWHKKDHWGTISYYRKWVWYTEHDVNYYSAPEPVWVLTLFDVNSNSIFEKGPWPKYQLDGHSSAISQSCATSIDPHGGW